MSEFTNSLVNLARTMQSSEQSKLDRQMQSEQFDSRNRLQLEMSRLNNEMQLKRDALSKTNQRRSTMEQRFFTLQEKLAEAGVDTEGLYSSDGLNEFNKDATGNMVEQMDSLDEEQQFLANDTLAMMKAMDEMSGYQSLYSTAAKEGLGDIDADFAGTGVKETVKTAEDVEVFLERKYGNPDELQGTKRREYQAEKAGYMSNLTSVQDQLQEQKKLKATELAMKTNEAALKMQEMQNEGFTPESLERNALAVDELTTNLVGFMRNELTLGGMPLIQYMADGQYNMQEINQQLSTDLAKSTKLALVEAKRMAPENTWKKEELDVINDVSAKFMGVFDQNPEVAAMTLTNLFDDANSGDDLRAAAALGALRKISTDPADVKAMLQQLHGLADLKTKIRSGNFNNRWKNRAFHEEITADLDAILGGSQTIIDKAEKEGNSESGEQAKATIGEDGYEDFDDPSDYPTALPADQNPEGQGKAQGAGGGDPNTMYGESGGGGTGSEQEQRRAEAASLFAGATESVKYAISKLAERIGVSNEEYIAQALAEVEDDKQSNQDRRQGWADVWNETFVEDDSNLGAGVKINLLDLFNRGSRHDDGDEPTGYGSAYR